MLCIRLLLYCTCALRTILLADALWSGLMCSSRLQQLSSSSLRQRVWQRVFASVATVFAGTGLEHTLTTLCAHASLASPHPLLALLGPRLAADEPRLALILT